MANSFWRPAGTTTTRTTRNDNTGGNVVVQDALGKDVSKHDGPLYIDGWVDGGNKRSSSDVMMQTILQNSNAKSLIIRNVHLDRSSQQVLVQIFASSNNNNDNNNNNTSGSGNSSSSSSCTGILNELNNNNNKSMPKVPQETTKHTSTITNFTNLALENVTFESDASSWIESLKSTETLKSLTIRRVSFMRTKQKEEYITLLLTSLTKNTSISILKLEEMEFNVSHAPAIAQLLQNNKTITDLSLRKNNLNSNAIKILAEKSHIECWNIKSLFLSYNPIGDDGVQYILSILHKCQNLHTLCIMFCEIWKHGCEVLAHGLASVNNLQTLSVDGNCIEECDDILLQSLKERNKTLQRIICSSSTLLNINDINNNTNNNSNCNWRKINYYLRLNRSGRKNILSSEQIIINNNNKLIPYLLSNNNKDRDIQYYYIQNTILGLQ